MIWANLLGAFFAAGVVTVGTLAGASAVGKGPAPGTSPAVASRQAVEARPEPMPPFLVTANKLWASSHDIKRVRETMRLALEDLAIDDARRAPRPDAEVEAASEDEVPAEAPGAAAAVIHMPQPVLIATRLRRSRDSDAQHSNWRTTWGAWHASLAKLPPPFADSGVTAIEIGIKTW